MSRSEYIKTIDGQIHEYFKRSGKNIILRYSGEPLSKNVIKRQKDKGKFFRRSIKEQLQEQKRRRHLSGLILEINFQTCQKDPPALQTLVKNYLDLLHKEYPDVDDLKAILFKDDNQIEILIANIQHDGFYDKPEILIKSYNLRYFIKDLEFASEILSKAASNIYSDDEISQKQDDGTLALYSDELKKLKLYEDYYLKQYGREEYDRMCFFALGEIQKIYLNLFSVEISTLLLAFKVAYFNGNDNQNIFKMSPKTIMFSLRSINLNSFPNKNGTSKIIKEELELQSHQFKEKHKFLFPLVCPIKLIIIYQAPNSLNDVIDPDNLARRHIIPIVVEIFSPPVEPLWSDKKNKQKREQPSIVGYEIIRIPNSTDNNTGSIDIYITSGDRYGSVWSRTDKIINDFIENYKNKYL